MGLKEENGYAGSYRRNRYQVSTRKQIDSKVILLSKEISKSLSSDTSKNSLTTRTYWRVNDSTFVFFTWTRL